MPTLTIVPLATPHSITSAAEKTILSADRLFVQTLEHPTAAWIKESGKSCTSMDDLYESCGDFDELNLCIARRLINGTDSVFAVLGRSIAEPLYEKVKSLADEAQTNIVMLPSSGFHEAALASAGIAIPPCLSVSAANALPESISTDIPLCIEELDSMLLAGEVKLRLSEFFPDSHEIFVFWLDGELKYRYKKLPLLELDRQSVYDVSCAVYVPAAEFSALERHGIDGLMYVLRRLRAPDGCPWDAEQTHETLKTPLIEEAYEVLDAINEDDPYALQEELGDLLLQIAFHAMIEDEKSCFSFRDVCTGIVEKLVFRHPHVFGNEKAATSDEVLENWEKLKKKEKKQVTQAEVIKAIPKSFPALTRSFKVQKKAADVGFDWDTAEQAFYKIGEETDELRRAMAENSNTFEELGDLLFAVVNVARLKKIDPELALSAAADKFAARFMRMEELILKDGLSFSDMTLAKMDEYWNKIKSI